MAYAENLDVAQFFTSDACAAAQIENHTLKTWIARGVLPLADNDRPAGGPGRQHLLSYRRVMQIAITAELVRANYPASKAAEMALYYTDVGTGGGGYGDAPVTIPRYPCELFPTGHTFLVVHPGNDSWRVRNLTRKTPAMELLFDRGGHAAMVTLINISAIDVSVKQALGLDLNWFRRRGDQTNTAAAADA